MTPDCHERDVTGSALASGATVLRGQGEDDGIFREAPEDLAR
jgi:hypothetical protein